MLIDSHCHLPHKKYEKSVDEIVSEAAEEGVEGLIAIGTSISESKLSLDTILPYKNIFSSVGVYPNDDRNIQLDKLYDDLVVLLNEYPEKIVAIGECGLDLTGWEKARPENEQVELFKMQIGLAIEHGLPVVIHNRNGDEKVISVLDHYRGVGLSGVSHCFTTNWSYAKQLLDLGFHISFTAIIGYPSASEELLEVVKKVPSDRYLVETDAPYLPPQALRGQTNYPKYVRMTAEKIAEIRKIPFEQVAEETYQNTMKLFDLKL